MKNCEINSANRDVQIAIIDIESNCAAWNGWTERTSAKTALCIRSLQILSSRDDSDFLF